MSKKINLFWYRHHEGHGNFGDELNHYIISRISSLPINHIDPYSFSDSFWIACKTIFYKIFFVKGSLKTIFSFPEWNTVFGKKIVFAIGSIISYYTTKNIIVWGSGLISKDDNVAVAEFRAVRGKYTQMRIQELGYSKPLALGDPALLLPLVYITKRSFEFSIGIIPHYVHYQRLNALYKDKGIKIINLLDPIEEVINDINSCKFTISTSLHGIIVSHSYGIQSLWVDFPEIADTLLDGDNIKFIDYFSSVNIPEVDVFKIVNTTELFKDKNNSIEKLFEKSMVPKLTKIAEIQTDLLKVAPFKLKKEFMVKTGKNGQIDHQDSE